MDENVCHYFDGVFGSRDLEQKENYLDHQQQDAIYLTIQRIKQLPKETSSKMYQLDVSKMWSL